MIYKGKHKQQVGIGGNMENKIIKHKVGFCSVCNSFVHDVVRPYTMTEGDHIVIKPICASCRKEEREKSRLVFCSCCGLVEGINLFPTTIQRLTFDEENTCNFIVPLCKECREKPHSEIREKLNLEISNICETCPDRFKCYTSKHKKPSESQVFRQDSQGFHKNTKITKMTKKWWR